MRIRFHKDIFPDTDHGYAWTERYWLEDEDGNVRSAISPCGGFCERLTDLPGGKIIDRTAEDSALWESLHGKLSARYTTESHPQPHIVNSVCIYPA